ncbi:MAG: hypothetical protein PHU85_10020, partial [Phycisphaerae bacterium]|nr:hypothetical protein [Phycisphaerae bacterium]
MAILKTALHYLVYVLVRIVDALVQIAGPDAALEHARRIGRLWWAVDRKHRNIALTNLANSFPEWTQPRREQVGRASFESLVCFIVDI